MLGSSIINNIQGSGYMLSKKTVFISHITEESELAQIISQQIKGSYLGMLDTFVSSDGESIPTGGRWLDSIDTALSESAIQISLCSPKSVKRPWINFEAGASWIRKIPVIPFCHSGMTKTQLPIPLSMLQAADYNNQTDLERMFSTLSEVLGSEQPNMDYTPFVDKCENFVHQYTYLDSVKSAVFEICNIQPQLKDMLFSGQVQSQRITVASYLLTALVPAFEVLSKKGLLAVAGAGTQITAEGSFNNFNVTITSDYLTNILPELNK